MVARERDVSPPHPHADLTDVAFMRVAALEPAASNGTWYTLVSSSGKITYGCVATTTNTCRLANG